MSKGKWKASEVAESKPDPVKVTGLAPVTGSIEEDKSVTRELNKDAHLHRAVLLCLNLLLRSARYGSLKRDDEIEIVAMIKELE